MRIELTPPGSISGRVLDRFGNPVANLTIQAVQPGYENGKLSWNIVQSRPTNDLGEYRIFWLNPSRYYIRTVQSDSVETFIRSSFRSVEINNVVSAPGPWVIRSIAEDGTVNDEGTFPVYYPGTPQAVNATPVDIQPGSQFYGIDFQFVQYPVHRVLGRITGLPGMTGSDRFVKLVPDPALSSNSGISDSEELSAEVNDDDTFEIAGVPAGSYILAADVSVDSQRFFGTSPVEVRNSDVKGVVVTPSPNVEIAGRFLLDGDPAGANSFEVFTDSLLRSQLTPDDYSIATIDGTALNFRNVAIGNYRIEAESLEIRVPGRNAAQPAYIESIVAGNQNVLQDGLHVTSPFDQSLTIVLRTDFARLDGRVSSTAPIAFGSLVVLIPENRNDLNRFKTVAPGPDGRFRFENIAPGYYKLFAWDRIEIGAWFNRGFLEEFESRGRPITLAPGGNGTAEIPMITREPHP